MINVFQTIISVRCSCLVMRVGNTAGPEAAAALDHRIVTPCAMTCVSYDLRRSIHHLYRRCGARQPLAPPSPVWRWSGQPAVGVPVRFECHGRTWRNRGASRCAGKRRGSADGRLPLVEKEDYKVGVLVTDSSRLAHLGSQRTLNVPGRLPSRPIPASAGLRG